MSCSFLLFDLTVNVFFSLSLSLSFLVPRNRVCAMLINDCTFQANLIRAIICCMCLTNLITVKY